MVAILTSSLGGSHKVNGNRIPTHFQNVKTDILDGYRVIEDLAFPDSMGHEFVALNDGSFIVSVNGSETLYGEAYLIKDGMQSQICRNGESVQLVRDNL